MHYPLSFRSMRSRAQSAGAALILAALLASGCADSPPVAPPFPNLETLSASSLEIEAAGATDGASRGKGHIAFARDGGIWIMNANGGGAIELTTAVTHSPELSPDGTRIAFVRTWNGIDDIYVMNADGSGLTRLTQNAGSNRSPAWSPDGTQISFASNRDGDFDIYVMNADGTGVAPLTANAIFDDQPAWSPDGMRIAFTTETVSAGNREIFAVNADGTNPVRLTTNMLWEQEPAWSPDGTRIAYQCDVVVSQVPFQSSTEICVMNADGTGAVVITNAPTAREGGPTWSPDGARIAFASDRDGDYDIYVVKANGGRVSTLTRNTARDEYPSWGK